jgi:hypothetical protein
VSLHPIYWQTLAIQPPTSPAYWSFSALALWRECPRRWWLENARYGRERFRYPRRVHSDAIEGTIVHRLLDQFASYLRAGMVNGAQEYAQLRADFPIRRELLAALEAECNALSDNPRVDVQQLRARVSMDKCLNEFRKAAPALWKDWKGSATLRNAHAPSARGVMRSPSATEKWLQAESPRIAGKADVIVRGVLIDYKTGVPSELHWQQLRFYALLHWLVYGQAARTLRVIYSTTGDVVSQDAPSESDLRRDAEQLKVEIGEVDLLLMSEAPPVAKPAPDLCKWCSVRQLCDAYWLARQTWPGTKFDEQGAPNSSVAQWTDVEPVLTTPVKLEGAYSGQVATHPWGVVMLRVGSGKTASGAHAFGARLLGARVRVDGASVEVSAGRDTEVFWLTSDSE